MAAARFLTRRLAALAVLPLAIGMALPADAQNIVRRRDRPATEAPAAPAYVPSTAARQAEREREAAQQPAQRPQTAAAPVQQRPAAPRQGGPQTFRDLTFSERTGGGLGRTDSMDTRGIASAAAGNWEQSLARFEAAREALNKR